MLFAYETERRVLRTFADQDAANLRCDGFDVREGRWLFFDEDGCALEPTFSDSSIEYGVVIAYGRMRLEPAEGRAGLRELLPQIADLSGPFRDIAELSGFLEANPPGSSLEKVRVSVK